MSKDLLGPAPRDFVGYGPLTEPETLAVITLLYNIISGLYLLITLKVKLFTGNFRIIILLVLFRLELNLLMLVDILLNLLLIIQVLLAIKIGLFRTIIDQDILLK